MFKKYSKNTLDSSLITKSIPCGQVVPNLNQKLQQYFIKTFQLYEKLFTVIKSESSFYKKPEPLRHPLIFYFGHTATFFTNKMLDRGIIKQGLNQKYQRMFAVGVDQNDWDDLDQTHYSWPSLSQVKEYRCKVKDLMVNVIQNNKEESINWQSEMWIVLMCIDHEKLHLQTSAVIIRRLSPVELTSQQWLKQCPFMRTEPLEVPSNQMKTVPAIEFLYDKSMENASFYGWDSEFGRKRIVTNQFRASKMLVSNGEFLEFYIDDGYKKLNYWTQQGVKWLKSTIVSNPVFWVIKNENVQNERPFQNYYLKVLSGQIHMPWDWPAEVNNLQARAFCNWKSQKTGQTLRLPTEDQYFALRSFLRTDCQQWQYQSVGNINLQFWCSPCPVDMFEIQGFCDIVGNVLQHTMSPMYPFQEFKIHPFYEDFTTPTFDQRHELLKGGCLINTGNSASMYHRTGFRRHFYLFSGFRYVQSDFPTKITEVKFDQSDQILQQALKIQYLSKNSYIQRVIQFVNKNKNQLGQKSLVVACSVGRLPLQLSKLFQVSYGIDYSARFFQMAARLLQKGSLSYRNIKIQLGNVELTSDLLKKVRLYQMNPTNTDKNKITNIDFMIIDAFNLKDDSVKSVTKNCFQLFKREQLCHALILFPNDSNSIQNATKELQQFLNQGIEYKVRSCFQLKDSGQKILGKAFFIQIRLP